jgi:hypothetical protein
MPKAQAQQRAVLHYIEERNTSMTERTAISPHYMMEDRNNFTAIPNIIAEMDLSVYAFRLYFHIKKVAGDGGACWQNVDTIAKETKMSVGSVHNAKQELIDKKLIIIKEENLGGKGRMNHIIKVVRMWGENDRYYEKKWAERQTSCSDVYITSCDDLETSCDDKNKIQLKQDLISTRVENNLSEIDNPLKEKKESTDLLEEKKSTSVELSLTPTRTINPADAYKARILASMTRGVQNNANIRTNNVEFCPEHLRPLAQAFMSKCPLEPNKSERGYWIGGLTKMYKAGITAQDIIIGYDDMVRQGLAVRSPESVVSFAWKAHEKNTPRKRIDPRTSASEVI